MGLFMNLISVLHKCITFRFTRILVYSGPSVFFESTVLTKVEIFEKKRSHKPQCCQTSRSSHVYFISPSTQVHLCKLVLWLEQLLCKVVMH